MPKPRKGEKRNKFMSRCISDVIGEGKDQKQAVAMCFSMWTENSEVIMASEDYIHVPVKKKKKTAKLKPITISKDIKAVYDVTNDRIVTYMFDKEKYSDEEAEAWVEENNDYYEYLAKLMEETYPKVVGERSDD